MINNRKKSPADILIEKLDEIDMKRGLPKSKTVNGKGVLIYIPRKGSQLFNIFKSKNDNK